MSSNDQSYVQLDNVSKSFNENHVLHQIKLNIKQGEFVSIVGKSGCGKSTLLRLVAGLEKASKGVIYISNERINKPAKEVRMMFQNGRLLPWKSVLNNVGLGLRGDWKASALKALEQVQLKEKIDDWPTTLSGGQQQRVSLARALVHSPKLMLLDEPLGALDALTRLEMQNLIEDVWKSEKFTAILVTHDIEEAVALSDRVLLIENGRFVEEYFVSLPRPRERRHPLFTNTVDTILKRVLKRREHLQPIIKNNVENLVH